MKTPNISRLLTLLALGILTAGSMLTSGCATCVKGVTRPMTVYSAVPGSTVNLNGGKEMPLYPSRTYDLKTYQKGPFTFTGTAPDGRVQQFNVNWKVNGSGKLCFWGGLVGTTTFFGLGGGVDLITDSLTHAARDLSDDGLNFDFRNPPPQNQQQTATPVAQQPPATQQQPVIQYFQPAATFGPRIGP